MAINLTDASIKSQIWNIISNPNLSKKDKVPLEVVGLLKELTIRYPDDNRYKKDLELCEGTVWDFLDNCHLYEYKGS